MGLWRLTGERRTAGMYRIIRMFCDCTMCYANVSMRSHPAQAHTSACTGNGAGKRMDARMHPGRSAWRTSCMGREKARALAVLASLLAADTYTITRGGRSQTSSAAGNGGAAGEEWTLWLWNRLVECGVWWDFGQPDPKHLNAALSTITPLALLERCFQWDPQHPGTFLCDPHRWYRRLHRVNCATRH